MYQERPARVPNVTVWRNTAPADLAPGGSRAHLVLPDGCLDLIWNGSEVLVAGPDTRPSTAPMTRGRVDTGVRFSPGTGPAVLGVPAVELRDLRIPLGDLWQGDRVRRLSELLVEAADPAAVLELLVAGRIREATPRPDPVIAEIVRGVRAGIPVAGIAASLDLSQRQLHRVCLAAFGYGAKVLGRILRMDRALVLARRGVRFAEVAAVAGYADQSHLAREVRALTGTSLGRLVGPAPAGG